MTRRNEAGELGVLDDLLEILTHASPSDEAAERATENLHAARTDLLGAMDAEYVMSLQLANEAVRDIKDAKMRADSIELLDRLPESRSL